ncbi:MAG: 3-deoxy-D-manno-octulosonic acid transferase, partial [Nitrospinota bacterium]
MYPLYNLALFLASPVVLPYYGWRLWKRGRSWEGLAERFGSVPDLPPASGQNPRVWVHAVSVGEVLAARPLLERLRERRPEVRFVLSTVTETGRRLGRERVPGLEALIYLPLDYPWAVRRSVVRLRPSLFVGLETELWPNLFRALHRRGVPVLVVNGRLSARSFRGYRALAPLLRQVLGCVSALGVQSEEDASRYLALGASPPRVHVTGNLKFDGAPSRWPPDREGARARFGLDGRDPVIVAGSTHRGEEEIILDCFVRLSRRFPHLGLLLAPRHLERLGEVEALARERGLAWKRRSEAEAG